MRCGRRKEGDGLRRKNFFASGKFLISGDPTLLFPVVHSDPTLSIKALVTRYSSHAWYLLYHLGRDERLLKEVSGVFGKSRFLGRHSPSLVGLANPFLVASTLPQTDYPHKNGNNTPPAESGSYVVVCRFYFYPTWQVKTPQKQQQYNHLLICARVPVNICQFCLILSFLN
jgi:hypothetical protein